VGNIKEIYAKFRNGDSLTDAEVKDGAEFFNKLSYDLDLCGEAFRLSANEARRVGYGLEQFHKERNKRETPKG
jgi:hypothetical protein